MTEDDVRRLLGDAVREAGSAKAWADQNNVSAVYVGDVLNRGKAPGEAILKALGLERVVTYRRVD